MTVVIAAGGTGGHLYPGVALAHEFVRVDPAATVRFVGTTRGIETKVLEHEGFALDLISALPVMGLGARQVMRALVTLPKGIWQAVGLLRRHRPDLVIGIGGYTSPPVLIGAWLLNVPRVILEPNACPGMANKVVAPIAQRIFVAYQVAAARFPSSKVRAFGTPVRRAFLDGPAPAVARGGSSGRVTVLVFGGSRGAHAINRAMMEALPHFEAVGLTPRLSIVHQTGEADYEPVKARYEAAGIKAAVTPFLYDMPTALRSADLVVSRSGAMTLAEVTACGKPAVLVPLPHSIYHHQARNAEVLESAGAALVVPQEALTGLRLAQVMEDLLRDTDRLRRMGDRSRALARIDSAEAIVQECLALISHRRVATR